MTDVIHALLIHNLGHHEVYVQLEDESAYRKIRNVAQYSFGQALLENIDASAPSISYSPGTLSFEPRAPLNWSAKKLRRRLVDSRGNEIALGEVSVERVVFPLIESAVQAVYENHPDTAIELHIALVSSGAAHDSEGSKGGSTAKIRQLMKEYLNAQYPDVEVHPVHRDTEKAFTFAKSTELLLSLEKIIQTARRPAVNAHTEDWKDYFRLYLSANTGTISDISTLLEGLRPHRPALVHISAAHKWPFDDDNLLVLPSAQILSNDELRQRPARPAHELERPELRFAVEEMKKWKKYFVDHRPKRAAEKDERNDANSHREYIYWFRKGKKEVLALVVTQDPETKKLHAHRGVNLEVSLPTGTLCAERNAIGSALATFPNIERKDVKAVAVLSLADDIGPRLGPCGACTEWLRKVAEVNPDFRVVTFEDYDCENVFVTPVE